MPNRIDFQANGFYHVFNRGLEKKTLFYVDRDYEQFLYYFKKYEKIYEKYIKIFAFCLLPNHFHFLIKNLENGLFVSEFICRLCGAYAKYFVAKYGNEKGKRIFESRFKSKEITSEKYLERCFAYVNLNPIKHKIVKDIQYRKYTSYHYLTEDEKTKISFQNIDGVDIDFDLEF